MYIGLKWRRDDIEILKPMILQTATPEKVK
jgi:hypothetical protein